MSPSIAYFVDMQDVLACHFLFLWGFNCTGIVACLCLTFMLHWGVPRTGRPLSGQLDLVREV
jgi:hypothetical protein